MKIWVTMSCNALNVRTGLFWFFFRQSLASMMSFFGGECSAHNSDLYFSDGFRACLSMSDLARLVLMVVIHKKFQGSI